MRLPPLEMCEVRDLDPLDGIDGVICASLLSRSRPPGRSIESSGVSFGVLYFPMTQSHTVRFIRLLPSISKYREYIH